MVNVVTGFISLLLALVFATSPQLLWNICESDSCSRKYCSYGMFPGLLLSDLHLLSSYSPICIMFATTTRVILKSSLLSETMLRLRWCEPFSVFLFIVCVDSEGYPLINRFLTHKMKYSKPLFVLLLLMMWASASTAGSSGHKKGKKTVSELLTIADPKSWPVYEWWVVGSVVAAASKLAILLLS